MKSLEKNWLGLALATVLVLVGWLLFSRSSYPEVGRSSYDVASALYSACNQKDVARVAAVGKRLDELKAAGEIPEHEAAILADLLEMAETGDWVSASRQTRKLMQAQIVAP